jgi:hypothetical protein
VPNNFKPNDFLRNATAGANPASLTQRIFGEANADTAEAA